MHLQAYDLSGSNLKRSHWCLSVQVEFKRYCWRTTPSPIPPFFNLSLNFFNRVHSCQCVVLDIRSFKLDNSLVYSFAFLVIKNPPVQNLWDMWINCTKCCRCKWSRVVGAVEWTKRGSQCSCSTSTSIRVSKFLAGSSISEFLAGLYGFCICDLLAVSLQCALMNDESEARIVKQGTRTAIGSSSI